MSNLPKTDYNSLKSSLIRSCPSELGRDPHSLDYKEMFELFQKDPQMTFGEVLTGEDFEQLFSAADDGDPYACYLIGLIVADGISGDKTKKSHSLAAQVMEWFECAAEAGIPEAQVFLANQHLGTTKLSLLHKVTMNKGFDWAAEAAVSGDADGMYLLGLCFLQSWGTRPNYALARYWLKEAASKEHELAVTVESVLNDLVAEREDELPF